MQDEEDLDLDDTPPFVPLYDLTEKVKEANLELQALETPPADRPKPARVKFKEEITEFEFWESDEDWSGEGLLTSTKEEDTAVLISDDENSDLLPLEEDVRLGFPHGAELPDGTEDDGEPVRPRVGPSSVEDLPVSCISDELCLALDLRDSDDDDEVQKPKPAPRRAVVGAGAPKQQIAPARRQRPWTAPSGGGGGAGQQKHRDSCSGRWSCAHLPHYNGLRSEYGLSKEQLEERKRQKKQKEDEARARLNQKQQLIKERQDENERVFQAWKARKQSEKYFYGTGREESEEKKLQKLMSETRRQEAEESYKQWLRKKRQERRTRTKKTHNTWSSKDFERFFGCMDLHTQRTFRIYLGFNK